MPALPGFGKPRLGRTSHIFEANPKPAATEAGTVRSKRSASGWAEFAVALGREIQRARSNAQLSQEDVAYRAGLSRYTFQRLEKGEASPGVPSNPSLQNVMAVAQVLGISIDELLPKKTPDLTAGR
jgi:DNA-binding XRE family transcriptional regulator